MRGERLRILVSGMVAGTPGLGGATWAVLQYVLGLRGLGHDVAFVEEVPPGGGESERYFTGVMDGLGLMDGAALLVSGTDRTVGMPFERLRAFAEDADLLVNLSGLLRDERLQEPIGVRLYVDLDPAFTQLWHEAEGIDVGMDGHTHFATVGLDVGAPGSDVPTCGRSWIPILPPVFLDAWPVAGEVRHEGLTSVGNWRGYGSLEWRGRMLGQRAHSVRDLIALPERSPRPVMPALSIHPEETADLAALADHGWRILDPGELAATPDTYRRFVQGSWGELGIAKSGYVLSDCGWFSDRSACYLASGRPVVAQETGFSRHLPTGEGLLAFRTVDEAVAGIESLDADYPRHRRAARAVAAEHLDSGRVLGDLLDRVSAAVGARS